MFVFYVKILFFIAKNALGVEIEQELNVILVLPIITYLKKHVIKIALVNTLLQEANALNVYKDVKNVPIKIIVKNVVYQRPYL